MANILLGIDTGGTFTDFVLLKDGELRVHKLLSNPEAPQVPILQGIDDLGLAEDIAAGEVTIIHGTTVATNATLEGKGVRTVYITNKGLADVLVIGRQTREDLYKLAPRRKVQPFEQELMLEVNCRLAASGDVLDPLDDAELDTLVDRVDALKPRAVAINLLFSFLDASQEEAIEIRLGDYFVSRSSSVLPEYREYERGITTWLNAWIGPLMRDYLTELRQSLSPGRLAIMQSSGLTIGAELAAQRAVNLLLSGPAGGLSGAMYIGSGMDHEKLMTFDMGGTSSDVALLDGKIRLTGQGRIAGLPVGVPMADIHTIGAGGGSIAYVDDGGLLQVGPASAGASPGPACYGKGGELPTVTDANLVLGRLRPDAFLGGAMTLDESASKRALTPIAEALDISIEDVAFGIVRIANEHMTQALRVISIQRGFDPRDFTLACFGGAGGLHFCDLAEALDMREAIVPVHSGVLSALGMLATPPGREMAQTFNQVMAEIDDAMLESRLEALESKGREELASEGVEDTEASWSLDLRYKGQTFTINIPWQGIAESTRQFHATHRAQYGHELEKDVELLNLRVHLEAKRQPPALPRINDASPVTETARLAGFDGEVAILQRETLPAGYEIRGPALLTEPHSTTFIKPDWTARVDELGNLRVVRE